MQLQPTFPWRTERVELFVLEPAHVSDAYVGWLADPRVNRYLESRFQQHDRASTVRYVEQMLANPLVLMLGIRSLELERHVGNIKIGPIDPRHGLGEVGIMIGDSSAWGRGIASDAIAVLARIAFTQLGLRKLTAGCYRSNAASARAFCKAGFHHEATRPRHLLLDGQPEDLILLARHNESTQSSEGALP
jgi:RimJ/RimL family protein N-acetyltransferase